MITISGEKLWEKGGATFLAFITGNSVLEAFFSNPSFGEAFVRGLYQGLAIVAFILVLQIQKD